jgi:hypothetical protein
MTFSLMTPENSKLSIYMPQEFVEHLFSNSIDTGDDLTVFADEVPVDLDQAIDSKSGSFIFVIPVEKGTETLELVGTMII